MADEVQAGYLRGPRANDDGYGPLVVAGVAGAALGGGLTNTELRAAAVPVSGPQTDTQARATPQPVAASVEIGTIYNGTTALTPKRAYSNVAAAQANSTVVVGVASKKIRVLAIAFVAGATATSLTFNSGNVPNAITCAFANAANGGAVLPFNPEGWFETAAGEQLSATTGAGSTTGVVLTYIEV